ncbi:MAG: hypothetical protein C3F02_04385 [Parcubacteria group bacterium]|nr:MAG: hypothetical protein C3F02_04385 [Parcubacteria group bacterium]
MPPQIIRPKSLELIAIQISNLSSGEGLVEFLVNCGVGREIIEYPNTKWKMVYAVLSKFASSQNIEDAKTLFQIIEEAVHPLMHNGDKEKSLEMQDNFNDYLQYDGYCLSNGKIVGATKELIEASEDRRKKREKERENMPVGAELQNLVSEMFSPATIQQQIKRPIPIQIVGGHIDSDVKIVPDTAKSSPETPIKTNLFNKKISFDDEKITIFVEDRAVPLPQFKNEHYLCRAMYEYKINEPVDWSIIYEKMTGYYEAYYGKPSPTRENWRIVYDAMDALNKRIKEIINTNDNLFTWQEKTIKRNY